MIKFKKDLLNRILPVFAFISLVQFYGSAQTFEDIRDLKVIDGEFSDSSLMTIVDNAYTFLGEDLDSLDLEFILSGPILGSILVSEVSEDESLTYGDLYDKFVEIKAMPFYKELRLKQIALSQLLQRPADYNNWEQDEELIGQLGLEEEELTKLKVYVQENGSANRTYEDLLIEYSALLDKQEKERVEKKRDELRNKMDVSPVFIEDEMLQQSATEGKPLLIYFTGHNCVNCRKLEQSVLFDPVVSEKIMRDFILVPLFVDDRAELTASLKGEVEINGRKKRIETVGDHNMAYQLQRFDVSGQPYLVILNADNEVIDSATYQENTVNLFMDFLEYDK